MSRTCLTIVLAAGKGSRMKSDLPKVLHKVAGLPMVAHAINCAMDAGSDHIAVVSGHGGSKVSETLGSLGYDAEYFTQHEQLGTANATNTARTAIDRSFDDVVVMYGDTPLVEADTLTHARKELAAGSDVVVVGFETDNPFGYGRLVQKAGVLTAIVEEKEATDEIRKIKFCNGGLMAFNGRHLGEILDSIGNENSRNEFFLTDAVAVANQKGFRVTAIKSPADNILGVNTRAELSEVEGIWQQRTRRRHMLSGVEMMAPDTCFFHHDTQIAKDVTIEPNVVFGPGVRIGSGARIRAFSHIEGASVGEGADVGPFARLRPGAELGPSTKVGNFCEVKNATIADGAKVSHLSYIGDASIGKNVNVGAGTITCNYDGMNKFRTIVGDGAFVGSNSSLVAPVTIGDNAYVASGSVITRDIEKDDVGFGRSRQENRKGLAVQLRARIKAIKDGKGKP